MSIDVGAISVVATGSGDGNLMLRASDGQVLGLNVGACRSCSVIVTRWQDGMCMNRHNSGQVDVALDHQKGLINWTIYSVAAWSIGYDQECVH